MAAAFDLTPAERDAAHRARSARIRLARTDPVAFNEYVLRDEKTGGPISMAPMHIEWQRFFTEHRRGLLWSHVEAGKTSQVSIGRVLFEIGRDPTKRVVIMGNAHSYAKKVVTTHKRYIESSKRYRRVFPHVKPSTPWTTTSITIERPVISKDPTVQALGFHGDIIGSRIDDLVLDDVLDYENTRTPEVRIELREWILQSLMGRLTEEARVWVLGNAYYADDLLHWLAEHMAYPWRKYPVKDEQTGAFAFPQQWNDARLEKAIADLGGPGHPEVDRQLWCKPRTDASSRCKEEWIVQCLARGEGIELLDGLTPEELAELATPEDGAPEVHIGVDIAVKRKGKALKRAGKSVVFVILSWPVSGERQVIWLKSGRWSALEIVQNTLDAVKRFHGVAHVEDNGAQDFILQGAHGEWSADVGDAANALVVLPWHTGGNKTHPVIGVESVFTELARSKWIIPSIPDPEREGRLKGATEELREWIGEMLNYTPLRHTGDHFMASWMAKEGARLSGATRAEVGIRIIGQDVSDSDGLAAQQHPSDPTRKALKGWEPFLRADR